MREKSGILRRRVRRLEAKLGGSREEVSKYVRVMGVAINSWQVAAPPPP
jgi:hypothetical protein